MILPHSPDTDNQPVLLVTLPWGSTFEPNLGLGILKSVLRKSGIPCDVLYGTTRMLRYLKPSTYRAIADRWGLNDFVFSGEFEPELSPRQLDWLRQLLVDEEPLAEEIAPDKLSRLAERFLRLRQEIIPKFLDDLMDEVDFSRYAYVGLTCLFDQTIASLALARRIKQQYPDMLVAFGGYALQRPVGPAMQRIFPEMDVVAYGDGEPVVVPLYEASLGLRPLDEVPNITYRTSSGEVINSRETVMIDLNDSPAPDYDDFLLQRNRMKEDYGIRVNVGKLPVESSRGCWYGAKNHCTFCGIDDETLRYRSKSAAVTESQLDELHDRYGTKSFRFADYIMPRHALKDFLPRMRERGAPWHLHYETKSNLKHDEIKLCSEAGIVALQPGIESLSTGVLKLMCKGVRAMQNVFTIFTMMRYRILPAYNFLFAFPDEKPEFYLDFMRIVPALQHLQPPDTTVPVMTTRYAPLQADPERFGGVTPKPHRRYEPVFSEEFRARTGLQTGDWCYVFENVYQDIPDELAALHSMFQLQVFRWDERYQNANPRLTFRSTSSDVITTDSRFSDEPTVLSFGPAHRFLSDVMPSAIWTETRLLKKGADEGFDPTQIRKALHELCEERIVVSEGEEYVWIAFDEQWNAMDAALYRSLDHRVQESDMRRPEDWGPWNDVGADRRVPATLMTAERLLPVVAARPSGVAGAVSSSHQRGREV